MSERRYDLNGHPLHDVTHITQCSDCGMGLVSATEFHPIAACEEFKRTHDSDAVWDLLLPMVEQIQRRTPTRQETAP